MNKPLYCFKLYETSGKVTTTVIRDYTPKNTGDRKTYIYRDSITHVKHYVYKSNLDKVVHNKMYTFDPDVNRALNIIENYLSGKYMKAKSEYMRCSHALMEFELTQGIGTKLIDN